MKALLFAVLCASAVDFEVLPVIPDAQPATYSTVRSDDVTCGAMALVAVAPRAGFGEQALIVHSLQNSAGGVCGAVLSWPHYQSAGVPRVIAVLEIDWSIAIGVSRAVVSGDFYVPPPCRGAQTFHSRDSPAAPGTVDICESGGFAFGRIVSDDVSP